MAIEERRMRFTVERYERMVEAGILTKDDRVELIDGEIVEMTPMDPAHSTVAGILGETLMRGLGERGAIRPHCPIALPPDSEPEPDIWLAEPPQHRYRTRHPRPDDLYLVVEVAETSHRRDRRKLAIYAAAGVREAWLVDVPAERIEVHRDPSPDGYRRVETVETPGSVSPEAFPEVKVAVRELFPE